MTIELDIKAPTMHCNCEGCKEKVEKCLKKLEGVKGSSLEVNLDRDKKIVKVKTSAKVEPNDVVGKLKKKYPTAEMEKKPSPKEEVAPPDKLVAALPYPVLYAPYPYHPPVVWVGNGHYYPEYFPAEPVYDPFWGPHYPNYYEDHNECSIL